MAVAASSSSGRNWNYDVFLSFGGADPRKIFVGVLYRALQQRAIRTFVDTEDISEGDVLSLLLKAIEDSRLSIVVLSENYASSTWCLKELVKILECMDAQNQIVVPVFYEVDPSHVRNLRGSFAEAFAKHEQRSYANKEEVQSWKNALRRVATLSGWDSQRYKDDGALIEEIVNEICKLLFKMSKPHGMVGIDYHLNGLPHGLDTQKTSTSLLLAEAAPQLEQSPQREAAPQPEPSPQLEQSLQPRPSPQPKPSPQPEPSSQPERYTQPERAPQPEPSPQPEPAPQPAIVGYIEINRRIVNRKQL